MHHAHGAGVLEVEQVVAVRDGVERVGDGLREAQELARPLTVERVGRAGEGCRAEWVGVGLVAGRAQAAEVAAEHPRVREHVVGEEHGLGVLEVRVARHHDAHVLLGDVDEGATKGEIALHELGAEVLGEKADVGRHLVVP